MLDGGRYVVTGTLLAFVFTTMLVTGTIWTFQMRDLLTETNAVQTLLNTLLSGIILLVSIVVSISAIVLSYDLTSIGSQAERVQEAMELRHRIGALTENDVSPRDPSTFLRAMTDILLQRARRVQEAEEGVNEEFAAAIDSFVDSLSDSLEDLDTAADDVPGADFGVLWQGIGVDYGDYMDRLNSIQTTYGDEFPEDLEEPFDRLVEAFELFATGRGYFKTLYYSREIAHLSRTLLIVSLPAIVSTAATILAIDARLLPELWLFGLPPLLTFVSFTFTVALLPFVILTSYMLRVATVAYRTASAGPFVLQT